MTIGGKGPTILAIMWLETVIAFIAIGLRFYTRKFVTRNEGLDDYLIIFMLIPYTVSCTAAATEGFGQHSATLTVEDFANATRSEIIGQTFSLVGIATSKASVHLRSSGLCSCITAMDYTLEYQYEEEGKVSHHIFDEFGYHVSPSVSMAEAVRAETGLHSHSAMVCGVIRTVYFNSLLSRSDYSYETTGLILWSSTELTTTILTATIPTYRPLLKVMRVSLSSTGRQSGRGYRLDNQNAGKKDLPPPAQKRRPKNDTTLMETSLSIDG
ncbi:hypothetical protein EYC80_009375 [Monilinia laxa]|uniref:Rhodopsin domain-containing protein n=1 Tax=Monilinia laxa TaxID=61186 RepID=A0A5N6JXL6_MONLA|nr:hypothetical protein EYC80_009375 [Monilinia laxa]